MEPATDTYMETCNELEEYEVLDSRAQQSRLGSKQFAGINLVDREDRAQQSREMDKL